MSKCTRCNGFGQVVYCYSSSEVSYSSNNCPTCHDIGYKMCPQCKGTGKYPKPLKTKPVSTSVIKETIQ